MNSILKKSSRRDRRIQVRGSCIANTLSSPRPFVLRILDLSVGGLSFTLKEPAFVEKSTIEIHFQNLRSHPLNIRAMIVSSPDPQEDATFRYSVRFERRLTETQYLSLLEAFDLQSPDLQG